MCDEAAFNLDWTSWRAPFFRHVPVPLPPQHRHDGMEIGEVHRVTGEVKVDAHN